MLAYALASKPCSEATNMMISLFYFLTVDGSDKYVPNLLMKEAVKITGKPNQGGRFGSEHSKRRDESHIFELSSSWFLSPPTKNEINPTSKGILPQNQLTDCRSLCIIAVC